MSMLAERRTKKKWCLNPNGKDWSNDDSKFGQRMLEKMGWKKGCGLGVNLQGMKEHVRVSAKNDTKGLGCKNNSDTEWIHHQQNFENLLSELACSSYEEIKPPATSETKHVSLEEKSKKSRVRVHYQKFTRGKDVTRYSANDLACIFGKKCSSLDSKSFDVRYSCPVNTRNIYDSDANTISDEHNVEQSLNLHKEKTTDDSLPKHSAKDKPMEYSHEVKDVPEKQNYILKEISNMEENSVAESLEKSKKKKKCVKDSKNNQEVVTETIVSSPQHELNDCDTVVKENHNVIFKEISNMEENSVAESLEKSKKKKKHVKDSKNNQEVVTETIVSSPQHELNDCDTVVKENHNVIFKEISNMVENSVAESLEKSKKKKKRVKDSKNNQEVVTETMVSSPQHELNDCDTVVKENQNVILEEISNMEENSVAKSLEKSKKKKKRIKESKNNQEVVTETMVSSPQHELNDCDTVVQENQNVILEEISNMEENSIAESLEKSKKKKKHVKDSKNIQEVVTETMVSSPQRELNDCDTVVQENQNVILKEISNMEKNSVEVVDLVEEYKSEMLDNSASQSLAESLEKIRSKRKRKHAKDSENNQEVVTVTIASSSQDELNDCRTVVKEKQNGTLKEISNMEENSVAVVDLVEECEIEVVGNFSSHSLAESLENTRSKRKTKRVKGSGNNQEVITETIVTSPQYEVNDCETVVHEVQEEEKKKNKKKKKDKKYKVKVDDGTGKEDNSVLTEEVEVISDVEETGNKDLETAGLIKEADTGGSKIKMKTKGKLYHTNISEECEECPEMKKRKKKKMCLHLNEPDAIGDITSETVSLLPPNKKARVNNVQESRSFASEPFSCYKKESLQHDKANPVKHIKADRKHDSEITYIGFVGSNLHSILGYGNW